MTFLDHSVEWLRGEAFEMALLAGVGSLIMIMAAGLWRLAPTPLGQALPIPLAAVALLFLVAGLAGSSGTSARVAAFTDAFEADPLAFVEAERARVDAFQALYTYTMIGAAVCFAAALAIFALSEHPVHRAVAVTLAFVGVSGLVVDMFSKERSNRYSDAINAEIARTERP